VTNHFGLVGGRDAESDDDYRFRLSLKVQSSAGANEAALRLELLEIPGIQDVVFERQAGAFIVYVYGISPNVSPGLLQNVQDNLNDKAAYPLTGLAVAPDLVGISLSTTVEFKAGTSAEEKSLALSAAASAAEDYVNNLRVGETLVLNQIADRLLNADPKILDGEIDWSLNSNLIVKNTWSLGSPNYRLFLAPEGPPAKIFSDRLRAVYG